MAYGTDFGLSRYEWEPDYLKDKQLTLDRFGPSPSGMSTAAKGIGGGAVGMGLLSLLTGAVPFAGPALGGIAAIASLLGNRSAAKEEEERRRKQEALQRAMAMSRSFEQSGWGGY
jgi:surface antigen